MSNLARAAGDKLRSNAAAAPLVAARAGTRHQAKAGSKGASKTSSKAAPLRCVL
jgi:hypothetical protein